MDVTLKERLLRITMMAMKVAQGHLRTVKMDDLADDAAAILTKCENTLIDMTPDTELGIFTNQE
jgi:formylmethanofuran dehydrogenase subunit B